MAKTLPSRPHIAWLKKTAKEQLAELRLGDPSAKLSQAQLAVARDYGFSSWRALKAHVDAHGLDGQLVAAAVNGQADRLDALLRENPRKLDVIGGSWNRPLLHLAAEGGHIACIDALLRRGFDVNARDRGDNATALHWAAQAGALAAVKRLLDAGADIDGEGDAHEVGVIGWATCFGRTRRAVADDLLARGAKPTIFSAVALGRCDLVRALVAGDSSLVGATMSRFEHRRRPLHLAVIKNRADMVALLLELGADPRARDDQGNTPLNYARVKTGQRVADLLIAAGADPAERRVNRFESAVPILNVRNVLSSLGYYVDTLAFEKEWDWGSPPTFACVRRDAVRIFLCQDGQGSPGTWMSIFVQDVDKLHDDYRRRGARIRTPPGNCPWGVREMVIEDPDGHCLRIGSDVTDEAVAAEAG